MLNDKVILITGGTGSFGKKCTEIILKRYKPKKLIVFCRDELKQFRVIQEDYDLIRVVVSKEETADKAAVENAIISDFRKDVRDEGMEYVVDFVDRIPPDPNGKIRLLISKVR